MKLAKTAINPLVSMLACFNSYWTHLDSITLKRFSSAALDSGYIAECESDIYKFMEVLKDMSLIDIEYINKKPYKIIKLRVL